MSHACQQAMGFYPRAGPKRIISHSRLVAAGPFNSLSAPCHLMMVGEHADREAVESQLSG